MPYTVKNDHPDCDGYAVVKTEDNAVVPGGCHATRREAVDHLIALEIAEDSEDD